MREFYLLAVSLLPLLARAIPTSKSDDNKNDSVTTSDQRIANTWIVQLKDEPGTQAFENHFSWLNSFTQSATSFKGLGHKFNFDGLTGYSGQFDITTLEQIRAKPEVALVIQDNIVTPVECVKQPLFNSSWGLGRISHIQPEFIQEYIYQEPSLHYKKPTSGVVYVLDSGIRVDHDEFGGRASHKFTADNSWNNSDNCGHGTHVTGTIIGKNYGVSKTSLAYSVKILDGTRRSCTGTYAGVIAGLDFAFNHARQTKMVEKSVINMSIGGPRNEILNNAIRRVVESGLTVVVAAGNDGGNACDRSPGSESSAITVGASDSLDTKAFFSNVGCCVDIFAPGVSILSASPESKSASRLSSGTSMASPHIAGLVLYNKHLHGFKNPADDRKGLVGTSIKGSIKGDICSNVDCCAPNSLSYNGGCT